MTNSVSNEYKLFKTTTSRKLKETCSLTPWSIVSHKILFLSLMPARHGKNQHYRIQNLSASLKVCSVMDNPHIFVNIRAFKNQFDSLILWSKRSKKRLVIEFAHWFVANFKKFWDVLLFWARLILCLMRVGNDVDCLWVFCDGLVDCLWEFGDGWSSDGYLIRCVSVKLCFVKRFL